MLKRRKSSKYKDMWPLYGFIRVSLWFLRGGVIRLEGEIEILSRESFVMISD